MTLKLRAGLPNLRRKDLFQAFKDATRKAKIRGIRVIHFSVQINHVHLLLECPDPKELSRQIQSLTISLSKRVNHRLKRIGAVFKDRYHVHVLRTPSETRNALGYVLTNDYKHRGAKGRVDLDLYSSALLVADETWKKLLGRNWMRIVGFPPFHHDDSRTLQAIVQEPKTWLLRQGWEKALPKVA